MSEVIRKPWGYEYCAFDNGAAAVWILHIARGRQTSRHCHPNKRTQLILLQGEARFNGEPLVPLRPVVIEKGEYHQTAATSDIVPASENGAFVMEIEEPSNKADIRREADAYGREAQPIEQDGVPCKVEMLKLGEVGQHIMGYTFRLSKDYIPDYFEKVGGMYLSITRDATRKVSDCVADFVRGLGIKHVFGVCGGGSMHLNDSFRDIFIPMHHEQAAAMAAEAYARMNGIGCALVTTGPGGTNSITGLACAWVDSIPVLFISGQVTTNTLSRSERQRGIQETSITWLVESQTKWAIVVTSEEDIRWALEKAVHEATSGRPGPVWIDIPLDVQSKQVNWDELQSYTPPQRKRSTAAPSIGQRPLLVIGNGVHLAHAEDDCRRLVDHLGIPVVSSWTGADIIPTDHPLYIGRFGIFGDRASNFTIQNAASIIVLGSRLSVPQTGHNVKLFARGAKITMVDADPAEMRKFPFAIHERIFADVGDVIRNMLEQAAPSKDMLWTVACTEWKKRYPVVRSELRESSVEQINSFHFIDLLCDELPKDAIVVTDMGTAFTCTFQAARMKHGQRWFTASGHAPMGYGLPGAIGAHYATGKPITCITGDGGIMFNLHCLQTIGGNKLPIKIYLLDNAGYLTMKHTFANHFGRQTGSDAASGVTFPDFAKLAEIFGVDLTVVKIPPFQPLIPRSTSMKLPDGSITSGPIEDLYPFLPRDQFKREMIVPIVEGIE